MTELEVLTEIKDLLSAIVEQDGRMINALPIAHKEKILTKIALEKAK